ncbi:MAG: FecR family protein, partial [Myxococcota bacterium]
MTNLAKRVEQAREHIASDWDETRHQRVKSSVFSHAPKRVRTWVKVVPVAAPLAFAAVLLVAWWTSPEASEPTVSVDPPPSLAGTPPTIAMQDGSEIQPADRARVVIVAESEAQAELRLDEGRARFDVVPNPNRVFRVVAGPVTVDVLGTSFDVTRQAAQTEVQVRRGRVRVRWNGGDAVLTDGEGGVYPPTEASSPTAAEPAVSEVPEEAELPSNGDPSSEVRPEQSEPEASAPEQSEPERSEPERSEPEQSEPEPPEPIATHGAGSGATANQPWESLARDGRYGDAFEALEEEGGTARLTGSAQELMLAADVARLSGHPRRAVEPLQRTLTHHASDPRAPLAAFTLGRVYLEELGQPREAAAAFARARRMAPRGSLAEDAL